ncbi:MAG TPA: glycosyltransferase family 4 protein, partial [Anaerolineae bacterium]|nr:glycosyltransferase family 4 protein [Anaerolineae bacterium]
YLADMLAADCELAQNAIIALPTEDDAAQEYRALGCQVEIWKWARLVHLARTHTNFQRVVNTHTRGVQFARQRMRALRADIVVTNSENIWFGGMAARSLRLPHLQVFHALTLEHHWGARPKMVRTYLRWLQTWSQRFIGVSQTVAQMLRRNGVAEERISVVSNGLNLQAVCAASYQPLPSGVERQIQGRTPLLTTLGRISAMKGHDLLIPVVAEVKRTFPNVLCLVGGAILSSEGVEDTNAFTADLKRNIAALELESNILFLDEIDYAPALLRGADVYVQPSRTESFCRAVVEALTCGTPVAAFAAGALPEVVGMGGLLAPPEDVHALAEAVLCLLTDETLRAKTIAAGQKHIRSFDVKYSTAALRRLLAEIDQP